MLDLALATKLVEALPDDGRLILLGDKDQLSAVETGTVFANLCATRGMGTEVRESVEALTKETLPETGVGATLARVSHHQPAAAPDALARGSTEKCGLARALRCRGVALTGTSLRTGRRDRGAGRACQGGRSRSGAGLALGALRG